MDTESTPTRLDRWQQIADIASGVLREDVDADHSRVLTNFRWEPSSTPELDRQRSEIRRILAGEE